MKSLDLVLKDHELIVLRVIGEWWELDLTGADKEACLKTLLQAFSELNLAEEISNMLPEEAAAMQALLANEGKLPVAAFTRAHGEVRLMGPGKLEREEPWFDPVSAAEALWYRGLIYRGFDETEDGVIEFYYLPTELLATAPNAADIDVSDTQRDSFGLSQEVEDAEPLDVPDDVAAFLAKAKKKKGTPQKGADAPTPQKPVEKPKAKNAPKPETKPIAKLKQSKVEQPKDEVEQPKVAPVKKAPVAPKPVPQPVTNLPEVEYVTAEEYMPIEDEQAKFNSNSPTQNWQPPVEDADITFDAETSKITSQTAPNPPARRILPIRDDSIKVAKNASGLTPLPPPRDPAAPMMSAVDDIATMLSLAQNRPLQEGSLEAIRPYLLTQSADYASLLFAVAWEMGVLRKSDEGIRPAKSAVTWLKQSRAQQTAAIAQAWRTCLWNELRHVPEIVCEGSNWDNDPKLAREAVLAVLPQEDAWFSLDELTNSIKKQNSDFQRPDGDYDTWYIRDLALGEYVRGFDKWALVEGRLIRYLLNGPMCWLGLSVVDERSFRLTKSAVNWLRNIPADANETDANVIVKAGAQILVPQNSNRYQRFSVARIAELAPVVANKPYLFSITPNSLRAAGEQKITPAKVLTFLQTASDKPLPASTKRAIERWGERAVEAKVQTAVILRVRDEKILDVLRNNEKTKSFIGEALGEFAAVVKPGEWENLRHAAAELGLLLDESVTSA